ncbi:tRNA 2-thiocytidine biosynthesis protein TtcA [bioreactor metagenome]|jgi:tRNA(Ile)-lysidine synthase TilS/MesJ|uniref:tRNA(Ile)-lysidine synthase TilS/MesJ n=2 Tax=root TaxID=1 RepID=A0A562JHL2_9FIRM|nr:ATP-binding protein [Sedimentibacter saalensis]MEA5094649.1 ATP-binding protein [Sedimentibacter saalensis]TWH82678.1 tRNA(Ile)-lysidine synthase TilS/MesJ [Sedimentibacter saalensis]
MEKFEEVERSIIKKYRKTIWSKFISGIKEYNLIKDGDKIAVCISGGKDSMLMAKCMQQLQKYSEIKFETEYLVMDPGYNPENRQRIIDNAKLLNIPIRIFDTQIFNIVENIEQTPCYLCARMRRGYLYRNAKELGCNKIALGHHFDDAIETVLMSMFYAAEIKTMMPKLHSTNFEGMELIRPMYKIHEEDIISWRKHNGLQFIQCACRFTEHCSIDDEGTSKRAEMKNLIKKMKLINPNVDTNIFRSIHTINLDTIIGYKKDGVQHSFMDDYDNPNVNLQKE